MIAKKVTVIEKYLLIHGRIQHSNSQYPKILLILPKSIEHPVAFKISVKNIANMLEMVKFYKFFSLPCLKL